MPDSRSSIHRQSSVKISYGNLVTYMSRKGAEVGQGMLGFVEDYCIGVIS